MTFVSYLGGRTKVGQGTRSGRLLLALCLMSATACGEGSEGGPNSGGAGESGNLPDDPQLTGTFTFGGKTVGCKTSDQDFPATGEYSVVCENDEAGYRFVQVTFKNEASARRAQDLTFMAPFAFSPEDHEAADAVAVSYTDGDGTLDSDDESSGSAQVAASGAHYVLSLTNVSLATVTSEATGAVSATISF
jgi:hypothetical protein